MTTAELVDVAEGRPLPLRHWAAITWLLSLRTFRLRYLRSRLGVGWVFIQPLVQAVVLAFIFTRVFKVHKIEHYPLYVLSGVMTWAAFSGSVNTTTTSAVDNSGLLKKVDVPRIVFPLSQVIAGTMVLCLQLCVLIVACAVVGTLSLQLLLLPVAVLLVAGIAAGIGFTACAFHVALRDVKFMVESGLLVAFYASPVLYDPSALPAGLRGWLAVNPMFGALSLVRAALLDQPLNGTAVLTSFAGTALLLAVGVTVFRRRSDDFADLV